MFVVALMNSRNRIAVRPFILPLLVSIVAGCAKGPTPPAVNANVAGEWSGALTFINTELALALTLSQVDSSITGSATLPSNLYFVTGNTRGDSVFLRMMPPEDLTIRVVGRVAAGTIRGESWLEFQGSTRSPITLVRR